MAGRTSTVSTSSFKPLDINEIMAVPLAKQKMEDDILNQADQFGQLSSDVLEKDSERATSTINSFKDRASSLSDEVISGGVNRSQFNKLRGLRNETTQEMGSDGFVGNAMANKKKVGQYVNALATKKERQGGYSPADAQKWAQAQVSNFDGTENEDGSFNSFSGAELSEKFDEDAFIDEAIERVAGEISETSVGILQTQGLPAFYDAIGTRDVTGKDYNTVMASIKSASQTNPDLMNHLEQQAFFDGSDEDVTDFGGFQDVVTGEDENGKPITSYEFVPGNSRYAKKMAGFGYMGSTKTVKTKVRIIKDAVAANMYKNGLDGDKASKMVKFVKGEYLDTNAGDLSEIEKLNNEYGVGVKDFGDKLNALKTKLLAEGKDPDSNKKYINLKNDYTNSKVGHENVNSYLKSLREDSLKSLSRDERGLIETQSQLKEFDGDAVALMLEEHNVKASSFEYESYRDKDKKDGGDEYQRIIQKEAKRQLAIINGVSAASKRPSYDYDIRINRAKESRDGYIQDNLDANAKATPYNVLQLPSGNKYATSKFKDFSDMNEDNMDIRTVSISGKKNFTLADYMETDDFVDLMDGDSFEIKKSFTIDGYNNEGELFNQLIIRSKTDPTKSATVQIDATGDRAIMAEIYQELYSSSDRKQSLEGEKGLANLNYMPSIKQSFLRYSNEGGMTIPLPGGKKTDEVAFSKNENGTYSGTLFGAQIEFNGNSELKGEQEFAVALKREVEDYMIAVNKAEELAEKKGRKIKKQ